MARINLLPWREEQRKQQQREFAVMLGGAAILGLLIVALVHIQVAGALDYQNRRNDFLNQQIAVLDKRIIEIKELESTKASLLARMEIIQQLQQSRPQFVHLFDELARTLPDGVYINSVQQRGNVLTIQGVAESNARISAYMRNLDASDWFADPGLSVIESKEGVRGRTATFTMVVRQEIPEPEPADKVAMGVRP